MAEKKFTKDELREQFLKEMKEGTKKLGHWIIPGDWIIKSVNFDDHEQWTDEQLRAYVKYRIGPDMDYADHAIYVCDATRFHLTVFDPWTGLIEIMPLNTTEGYWHLASKKQVTITWEGAHSKRMHNGQSIPMEREKFPYKFREVYVDGEWKEKEKQ